MNENNRVLQEAKDFSWIWVVVSTLSVTSIVALLLPRSPETALVTGAIAGTSALASTTLIDRKKETQREIDCEKLRLKVKEVVLTKENYEKLKEDYEKLSRTKQLLIPEVQELKSEKSNLIKGLAEKSKNLKEIESRLSETSGTHNQRQSEYETLTQQIEVLTAKKNDLDQRIAVIYKQQPDLVQLEKLCQDIASKKVEISSLDGQFIALIRELQRLTEKQQELKQIESQFYVKQAEYDQLSEKIQTLKEQVQSLEAKATDLEFLRATYDRLVSEKEQLEQTCNHLRPEIQGLEEQKQHILAAIRESEQAYQRVEEKQNRLQELNLTIQQSEMTISRQNRELARIQGIINSLEERQSQLEQDNDDLRQQNEHIKGEIQDLEDQGQYALQALAKPLWSNLPSEAREINSSMQDEERFLDEFQEYLTRGGFSFPRRVTRAFHTSLKVQDISALVILAGISGTGKSELPQRYADYIGAQQLILAVQPRWDSPQDLQGFFNYIEKKYKPTNLMRGLWQYHHDFQMRDRIVMVLLDEMNLAKVEYYFSDFLSKLETRRSRTTYLELELGSLIIDRNRQHLPIPQEFLFVGTMNEDETTQSLSDKVLDRANVLTFGKPEKLKLREENQYRNRNQSESGKYLPYSKFRAWNRPIESNSEIVNKVREYLDKANKYMEALGHPFAHRVYQAITYYVVNYPGVTEPESPAFYEALADQFGQKLLPKLRGIMVEEAQEEFNEFSQLIVELRDLPLINAFQRAVDMSRRYGQFQWTGLAYPMESE